MFNKKKKIILSVIICLIVGLSLGLGLGLGFKKKQRSNPPPFHHTPIPSPPPFHHTPIPSPPPSHHIPIPSPPPSHHIPIPSPPPSKLNIKAISNSPGAGKSKRGQSCIAGWECDSNFCSITPSPSGGYNHKCATCKTNEECRTQYPNNPFSGVKIICNSPAHASEICKKAICSKEGKCNISTFLPDTSCRCMGGGEKSRYGTSIEIINSCDSLLGGNWQSGICKLQETPDDCLDTRNKKYICYDKNITKGPGSQSDPYVTYSAVGIFSSP